MSSVGSYRIESYHRLDCGPNNFDALIKPGVSMSNPNNQKPKINYPCQWGFKVIGNDEETVHQAVRECLADCLGTGDKERPVEIGDSRTSGGGKYVSVGLTLEVMDEEERNIVFQALAARPEIKMVI